MIVGNGLNPYSFTASRINTSVSEFTLEAVYPNPFNPITNIRYSINKPSNIKITIFDVRGRQVEVIENEFKEIGTYAFTWNALNHSSGIYYVQIQGDSEVETQKVVLLK